MRVKIFRFLPLHWISHQSKGVLWDPSFFSISLQCVQYLKIGESKEEEPVSMLWKGSYQLANDKNYIPWSLQPFIEGTVKYFVQIWQFLKRQYIMRSWHLKFSFAPKPGVRFIVNKLFNVNNKAYLFQATLPEKKKKEQFLSIIAPPNPVESWNAKYQCVWIKWLLSNPLIIKSVSSPQNDIHKLSVCLAIALVITAN